MTLQGKNAMQAPEMFDKGFTKIQSEAENVPKDPAQRAAVHGLMIHMRNEYMPQVQVHTSQQMKQYDTDTTESILDNEQDKAAMANGHRDLIDGSLTLQVGTIKNYGMRNGLPPEKIEEMVADAKNKTWMGVINRTLQDGRYSDAKNLYADVKGQISDPKIQEDLEKNIKVVPLQQEELKKRQQEMMYENNLRSGTLTAIKGDLLPGDPARMFKDGKIDESGFRTLKDMINSSDYLVGKYQPDKGTDAGTFNKIRESQLLRTQTPDELTRTIAKSKIDGNLSKNDALFLMNQTKQMPADEKDNSMKAQINNLRNWAQNYYTPEAGVLTRMFGQSDTEKKKVLDDSENIVKNFINQADKEKATGDRLSEIREEVKMNAMQEKYPGLGNYKNAPDIVINAQGHVIRVLNPDEKSKLTARYKITLNDSGNSKE